MSPTLTLTMTEADHIELERQMGDRLLSNDRTIVALTRRVLELDRENAGLRAALAERQASQPTDTEVSP